MNKLFYLSIIIFIFSNSYGCGGGKMPIKNPIRPLLPNNEGDDYATYTIPVDAIEKAVVLDKHGYSIENRDKAAPSIKRSEYYINGVKVGDREWYGNGHLKAEIAFKNGQRHGLEKVWYESGSLYEQGTSRLGKVHGERRTWFESGKAKSLMFYKNNVPHGLYTHWDVAGHELSEIDEIYINGNRLGQFNVNGKAVTKEEYEEASISDDSLPKFESTER